MESALDSINYKAQNSYLPALWSFLRRDPNTSNRAKRKSCLYEFQISGYTTTEATDSNYEASNSN